MLILPASGENATENLFSDSIPGTWRSLSRGELGYNRVLLVAQAFLFVSIHLIQSETTQHAKLKLAGEKV